MFNQSQRTYGAAFAIMLGVAQGAIGIAPYHSAGYLSLSRSASQNTGYTRTAPSTLGIDNGYTYFSMSTHSERSGDEDELLDDYEFYFDDEPVAIRVIGADEPQFNYDLGDDVEEVF